MYNTYTYNNKVDQMYYGNRKIRSEKVYSIITWKIESLKKLS